MTLKAVIRGIVRFHCEIINCPLSIAEFFGLPLWATKGEEGDCARQRQVETVRFGNLGHGK
jgi:hypothetical protein